MLNALIAIMGDTYDRVSETKRERGLLNQADFLLEKQKLMSTRDLANPALFPAWVHCIEKVDSGGQDGEQWSGQLSAIKRDIRELRSGEDRVAMRLDDRVTRSDRLHEQQHKDVTRQLRAVEQQHELVLSELQELKRAVESSNAPPTGGSVAVAQDIVQQL